MVRPKHKRKVERPPIMEGFKPFGIPMHNMEPLVLLYEEYEAIRLMDYEEMTQEEAAKLMDVSRPTFTRVYDKARKTMARAMVEGKAILFEGGNFRSDDFWYRCKQCKHVLISDVKINQCNSCNSDNILVLHS